MELIYCLIPDVPDTSGSAYQYGYFNTTLRVTQVIIDNFNVIILNVLRCFVYLEILERSSVLTCTVLITPHCPILYFTIYYTILFYTTLYYD